MPNKVTAEQLLAVPLEENDSRAFTVRGYLHALLKELWREGESFSGKRPFGNSGWEFDIYKGLIQAGLVEGKLDDYGCVDSFDEDAARKLVLLAIDGLLETPNA